MYIPTTSVLRPAAKATASVVARQLSGLTPPWEKNGNPFHHDPTDVVITPDSTDWYGAVWVVPVAWALTFYCVVSLLLLCTLYGQGIVDGKLNYIPRHLRPRHGLVSSRDAAYPGRGIIASGTVTPSDTGTIIDYAVEVHGVRDSMQRSHRSSYLSNVGDPHVRTSITSDPEERAEHALFAQYASRPEVVRRQLLVEQLVMESERDSAERAARGEDGPEPRQSRDLAMRLEVARIESALAAAGVL